MGVNRKSLVLIPLAAILCGSTPASASIAPGAYRGTTNQDRIVHAKVVKNKIKRLSFSVYTQCGIGGSGGGATDVLLVENVRVKSDGSFKAASKGDSSNGKATFELIGKAKGKRLTGSVEQFFRNGCQTFELEFSAKRR